MNAILVDNTSMISGQNNHEDHAEADTWFSYVCTTPDPGWAWNHGLNPTLSNATGNPDNDPYNNAEEYTLNHNPNVSNDWFRITSISNNSPFTVFFESSLLRNYALLGCTNLSEGVWQPVVGPRAGVGGTDSMTDGGGTPAK